MTEEEIKIAKERYKNFLNEEEELKKDEKRLEELKNDPKVIEYLDLQRYFKRIEPFDYSISNAFSNVAYYTKESNEILVYIGQMEFNFNYSNQYVDSNGDFAIYRDLETSTYYKVRPECVEEFEKKHNVIHVEDGKKEYGKSTYEKGYQKLRDEFFQKLMDKPQEEAVKELFSERGYTYKKIKK